MAPVTPVTPRYAYRNTRERPPAKGSQPLVTLLHLFPDTYTYIEMGSMVCVFIGGAISRKRNKGKNRNKPSRTNGLRRNGQRNRRNAMPQKAGWILI